jgi:glycosyltransferase involved in cell wall biosynthesis
MPAPDLVSVVIPTRNRRARLLQALGSVREQLGVNIEIVVVDDGSTDGTQDALEEIAKGEPGFKYVRHEIPLGGGGARNAGVSLARGNYIAFLDDDDQWLAGKLKRQLAAFNEHPEVLAISCGFIIDSSRNEKVIHPHLPNNRQELLRANILGGASVCLVRKSAFQQIGGFDTKLRSGQDWDLWLKLHAMGPIYLCDDALVRYFQHHDGSITDNPWGRYLGRRRIHLRYRLEMSPLTRRYSLCELSFYRWVVFQASSLKRIKGLIRLVLLARGADRFRFVWRTWKYMKLNECLQVRQ